MLCQSNWLESLKQKTKVLLIDLADDNSEQAFSTISSEATLASQPKKKSRVFHSNVAPEILEKHQELIQESFQREIIDLSSVCFFLLSL